jgi:hypothetical protein
MQGNFGDVVRIALSLIFICLVCGNASAEWTFVARAERASFFIDQETLRQDHSIVKIWDLTDLTTPNQRVTGIDVFSMKSQREYDCENERTRILYSSFHTGKMGTGDTAGEMAAPASWVPVAPGSVMRTVWKIVCGMRQ